MRIGTAFSPSIYLVRTKPTIVGELQESEQTETFSQISNDFQIIRAIHINLNINIINNSRWQIF